MKTFSKVLVMFLAIMLCIVGTSFAHTTPPTFTPNITSGSVVEPGDKLTIVIQAATDTAISACTYSWNDGATKNIFDAETLKGKEDLCNKITFTFEAFSSVPGVNILDITAIDEYNNTTRAEFKYIVEEDEDNVAPTISADVASGSTVNAGRRVVLTIVDDVELDTVRYSWNDEATKYALNSGKGYDKYTYTLESFPNVNDTFKLKVIAKDVAGNITTKVFNYNVVYNDTTAPFITMSEKDGSVLDSGTKLVLNVQDEESKVTTLRYNWEGSSVNDMIPYKQDPANTCTITNITLGTLPGTYRFHVTAINSVGKKREATFTYVVEDDNADTTNPTVSVNPGPDFCKGGEKIKITAKDNEALKKIVYNWDSSASKVVYSSKTVEYINTNVPYTLGKHVLYILVEDAAGNKVETQKTYWVLAEEKDEEDPTITMDPKSGSTVSGGTVVKATLKDNVELKEVTYSWNDEAEKTVSLSGTSETISLPALPYDGGTYIVYITVKDEAGNVATGKYTYYIEEEEKDEENPTIAMDPKSGSTVMGGVTVKATLKDDIGLKEVTYSWNDEAEKTVSLSGTSETISLPTLPYDGGTYIVYITVKDEAGNVTTGKYTYYIEEEKDDEAPTITVSPKSGSTVSGGKVVKATLKDNVELKQVTYNWDDETEKTVSLSGTSKTISLPALSYKEGTYKLYITVKDEAGNVTTGKYTYYVEEDDDEGEYPTVDADPDGGDVEFGDKITIWAEDEDGDVEYIEYYWDDEDDDTTKKYDDEFTVKVPSDEGKHYLFVRAMDDDDNLCDYERFTYYIEENKYPGNSDIVGDVNTRVRALRVEIRNADDKIRFEPDEEILYYVDYYNGSSSSVKNAKLVVELPTYLEADNASDKGSISTKKVTWSLGTLNKGEYGRVSFTAHYTSSKVNEKIITVPAKIYSGSSLKDTSTVRNMIFCEGASGTGNHEAYCVGYPDGTFRAEGRITRAELASMIANIEGITATHRGQFTDANNHWAANYMQAVVDRGYMIPKTYNRFGAQDYATRADLAYAIAAILEVEDLEPIFISATDTKNSDARCAIEQLLRLGIMDGYSDGTAKPNSNITRAEAVTIFNNYLFRGKLYTKGYNYAYNFQTNYNHGGSTYILKFTDLSTSHWAYGHIMEATNNHRYERVMDGNEEML